MNNKTHQSRFHAILLLSILLIAACSKDNNALYYGTVKTVEADGEVPNYATLPQNWSQQEREDFWFTSQGSQFIPYVWFTWLEQVDSTADNIRYFRNTEHIARFNYVPANTSKKNPAGLPIGFALHYQSDTGLPWLGFTCAACHTTNIEAGNKNLLIEGAPTLANMMKFHQAVVKSLISTRDDKNKLERLAKKVMGEKYDEKHLAGFYGELNKVIFNRENYLSVNRLGEHYPNDFYGYGRVDAFGIIQNAGSALAMGKIDNNNEPNAPVSYPFLWGAHQSDYVQWNGALSNEILIGPFTRNLGEVVGVDGNLSIEPSPAWKRWLPWAKNTYNGTMDFKGLGQLEALIRDLRSPKWPDSLPAIDTELSNTGKFIYEQHCLGCHTIIAPADEGNTYNATLVASDEVGTDPLATINASEHSARTYFLEGQKVGILAGETFAGESATLNFAFNGTFGMILKNPVEALEGIYESRQIEISTTLNNASATSLLEEHINEYYRTEKPAYCSERPYCYKARPLNGIWATAPYLHNGSVPSLADLLKPETERPTKFWVGNKTFDPEKVGYISNTGLSLFKVFKDDEKSIQAGNSNRGHQYGTALSDSEKKALIEFLKTL